MVERKEVEALLYEANADIGAGFGASFGACTNAQLAALCRAWLKLEEAPTVTLEWGDFNRGLFIDDSRATAFEWEQRLTGQRVRIVPVEGDQ